LGVLSRDERVYFGGEWEIATVFEGDRAAVMNTIPEIAGKGVGRGNVDVEETKAG
jgi:hypothetical protein